MTLSTPLSQLPGVGPITQRKLKQLGLKTIRDLFYHFPHRYEDFSNIIPISEVKEGETVCVQGKITDIKNIRIFKRRMVITESLVNDNSGTLRATWFNQPYLINSFKKGDFVFLAGKMVSKKGKRYLSSPAYEKIPAEFVESLENGEKYDSLHIGRIIPVYPETEGMSSRWLRFIIKPLLTELRNKIPETLPEEVKEKNNFLSIKEAIWQIHFPDTMEKAEIAKKGFVFEELFDLSLFILKERMKLAKEKAIVVPINLDLIKKFVNGLPFKLTDDQRKASWQILKDLGKGKPMNRLLDGDVGSGKTIVAIMAALNTIKAGYQVAFMAPTEILAKQHFKTINSFLKGFTHAPLSKNKSGAGFRVKIGLITGKENYLGKEKIKRKEIIEKIKNGKIDILIGTHAIIQEKVEFKNLGLVIIDEQHRFGVDQRTRLCRGTGSKIKLIPHLLSMSATPIPRTLALTIYGDLDLSLIKEMPKGRKKVITKIILPEKRKETYDFIRKEVKKGKQIFVICPRIEPLTTFQENNFSQTKSTKSGGGLNWADVKAVKEEYEKLKKDVFPDLNVDMLHGKMKTEEKEKVLLSFRNKKTDILVSTSVIEVGIDFPNATIMMIEGADKFGLAQLHQFRGRVGRGEDQSYCFLFSDFYRNPRLRAMTIFQDGFELAEKDLKLRGPGDLIGQRQWGIPDFVMASMDDLELIEKTRNAAKEILEKDPNLKKYPLLEEKLKEFGEKIHLE